MIPLLRFNRYTCMIGAFCLLVTMFAAAAAADAHIAPTASGKVYLPQITFRACQSATPGSYCLVDLGAAGQFSEASALNQHGDVAGAIFVPASPFSGFITHPALATSGSFADLPISAQSIGGWAYGINDSGLVVGNTENRPFRWSPATGLQLLTVADSQSEIAWSVNNAGAIVGFNSNDALLWEQNQRIVLSEPAEAIGNSLLAYDINNTGQIVGTADITSTLPNGFSTTGAVLWQNRVPQLLEVPTGYHGSSAWSINNTGQIAGSLSVSEIDELGYYKTHAAIWQNNQWQDLGTLVANKSSRANDINSQGLVVGYGELATSHPSQLETHALLWQNGAMIDLNTRIAGETDWEIKNAKAINDSGVILVQIRRGQEEHAALLIPAQ